MKSCLAFTASAAMAGEAGFAQTGGAATGGVPCTRGLPDCGEAQEGVVHPLSESSPASLMSTQSSAQRAYKHPQINIPYISSQKSR